MGDVASVEAIRKTPEYQAAKKQLADREWRLENLYWISNKDGVPIPFKRNLAQRMYSSAAWYRDTILKSRRLGFSTLIAIEMLDGCLFASNTEAGIIDRTLDAATDKLGMARFAYERLPQSLRHAVPLVTDNQKELVWANGSSIVAGTSYRGGAPRLLHVSEYGPISAKSPDVAREIKNGSFPAVPKNGKIWVESTPMGTAGEFFDLVQAGEQLKASGQALTPLDFKLHFFSWNLDPDNRLPINLVHVPADMREYFQELKAKHGIETDGMQQAWYVKTREFYGPDAILSEFPSTASECFFASLEGAYFKNEMNQARRDGRVGQPVPYDATRPVNTSIDIGMDGNLFVLFMQTDGVRHRFIDAVRGEHAGLMDFLRIVKEKNQTRGFQYLNHYAPHDIETRDWSNMSGVTAKSRKEVAAEHGVDFIVVPRIGEKQDSIEAARRMINTSYFCSDYAGDLVECLENYTRGWNKTTAQWLPTPAKNGFDHGADSYQNIAMGLQPDRVIKRDQFYGKRKGSHWSA